MHHAPIKPDDEREWPPVRSRGSGAPRVVLADIGRLDQRSLSDVGEGAGPPQPKDRRRPGMY